MTINIEETGTGTLPEDLDPEQLSLTLLNATAEFTDAPFEMSCDILLCDEEMIRSLNRQHRGIDRVTDVLSFPNLDFECAGKWPEDPDDDVFDPDSGELLIGSIALCKGRVLDQAEEYGHSVRREFAFLLTHSMLHLSGYDHMTDEDRVKMENAQRVILEGLHLSRDEA